MDFRDKDGQPLIPWRDSEGAFNAWRACSRGTPCDYSGLTYEKLRRGGIQWPCTDEAPDGTERLYTNGIFNTAADACELYGPELTTGAEISPESYRATDPRGRAMIKAVDYMPPVEEPDAKYPFWLTTGRVVYHWHTRTKTGRVPALRAAAPEAFVQIALEDARRLDIEEGDWVRVGSRRGVLELRAKVGDIAPGHLFVPFHYGSWDPRDASRTANDLTLNDWDPSSKQPHFKFAAVWLRKR